MTEYQGVRITTGGKEYHGPATELISRCFVTDPAMRLMLSSMTDETRLAYLPKYISIILKAAAMNEGVFEEANDWSSCTVWMLPGKRVDNPLTMVPAGILNILYNIGVRGCKRMLWDFQRQSDAAKAKGLRRPDGIKIKKFLYLFFIATDEKMRGQGLASKMVASWQEKARRDEMPIWLEATTEHSRDVYARLGFEVIREIRLGEGTHAASGAIEKGGPGIVIWAMIWRPDSKEPEKVAL